MKKTICVLFALITVLLFSSCGKQNEKEVQSTDPSSAAVTASSAQTSFKTTSAPSQEAKVNENEKPKNYSKIDVDLTKLSSTMVYSEVYNMVSVPQNYIGKVVKMHGQFAFYEDHRTGNRYYACIISDATACCSQGLEFVLSGSHSFPDDYPEESAEITVVGIFETYIENGTMYFRLADAKLEK